MEEVQRTGAGGARSFLLSGSHPPHLYMLSIPEALQTPSLVDVYGGSIIRRQHQWIKSWAIGD